MAQPMDEFTIGALSKRTGVKIETIRYYEKSGIMPNPPRSEGGYRMYREVHLDRLRFIRRCRQLGFSMAEIEGLLGLVDDHGYTCGEVRSLTIEHADMVKQKIKDLKRLEKTLRNIAAQCTGKEVPDCPIIDALQDPNHRLELQS